MKRIGLLLTACLLSFSLCQAQENKVDVKPELVYSADGFVYRMGSFKIEKTKYTYCGLYTTDGKVCVKMFGYTGGGYVCIAPGTEIIANCACLDSSQIFIPKSVKQISTGAFPATCRVFVYDESTITEQKEDK